METITIKLENDENIIEDGVTSEADTDSMSFGEEPQIYQDLSQTGLQVCTDDYPGQFNFDIFLDITEISKRHWMYSAVLNKVYIDMDRVLPIQFQWQFDEVELLGIKNLQIRALPIFANSEFQQLSIKRCPLHIMQDKVCDKKKMEHILWCQQNDAVYEKNPISQRHSVVAVVHNSSPCSDFKSYNVIYKFMCKSSCSMSLSRRPIFVIFTLETLQGKVLGRKKIGVKVCSCPRRDMLKEEELERKRLTGVKPINRRRSFVDSCEIPGKIQKVINDNTADKTYELPILPIVGKKLYLNTLELLHGHFLGSAIREDHLIDSHPLISMLSDLISKVKSENN